MLTKEIAVSQIEITEGNQVQVRTSTRVMEDGLKLSESYHRHVISPGDDYSQEDAKVQAICAAVHTPEVIAAFRVAQTAQAI
jgi:hypothetical protein